MKIRELVNRCNQLEKDLNAASERLKLLRGYGADLTEQEKLDAQQRAEFERILETDISVGDLL